MYSGPRVLILELEIIFLLLKRKQIQSKRGFKLKIGATCTIFKFGHKVDGVTLIAFDCPIDIIS